MQWSRIVRFALAAFVLVPVLSGAQTLPYEYRTILDTDDNPANGCSVVVGADQFQGAEILITIFVDPSSTSVTLVEVQSCLAGVWSSPVIVDASGWPIGLDIGVGGADVVEGYLPITLRSARLGFTAAANLSSDVLFTDDGGGSIGLLFLADIPVNSGRGLLLFIVLMAAAGLLALRRGYGVAAVALFCVFATVTGVGVVLACQPDGNISEWAGLQPVATDPAGDALPGDPAADLVAAFVAYESGELCIRLDIADLENRSIDLEKATNGHDADLPPGPSLSPGDPVTWTYVVTNTGIVPLHSVTVTDDQGVSVSCPQSTLDPGQSMTCTASGTAVPCPYANIATVTGSPPIGPAVSDSDASHYSGGNSNPAIDIEKATNGHDADAAPGPTITEGQPVTWTYVVTNTGDTTLSSVSITDDQGVTVNCPASSLLPGQTMSCTASGTAIGGQYANIGTVTGTSPCGDIVSDTDPSHYLGQALVASIRIEKATNGHDADTAPGPTITQGQPVTWTYVVTNTGDISLSSIGVTDNQGVAVSCPVSSLTPGQSMTCTASGLAIGGQYANIGSVNGTTPTGSIRSDSDSSHYFGQVILLSIDDVTVLEGGGNAVFTVTMSNPSSQTVTVDYATAEGTASAGADYTAIVGTLTFNPGETSKTLSVPVLEDLLYEASETFSANLINSNNATLSDDQGLGTILDNDVAPSLLGKIVINEIGVSPAPDGRSFVEFMSLVLNAADTTPAQMQQLGLYIVGQNGRVVRINEGFVSNTLPAQGTMVAYEDGVLEIRNKLGGIKNIGSDADWTDYAEVYIGGAWVSYDPSIHDFAFGDSTADPVLVNFQQSGISIDFFVANDPVPDASPTEVMDGTWYSPDGAPAPEGDFSSFDGSVTDDIVFARVFITVGTQPFVIEPGEIDSDTAADWTINSTPTVALIGLNPTQVAGANPDNDDGQTVLFGTESGDVIEGKEGPDFLFGRGGDDTVAGGGGDNLLSGGPGDDHLVGGPGDDLVVDTDTDFEMIGGGSIVDGGLGIDIFKFVAGVGSEALQLTNGAEVAARLVGIEILDMRDVDSLDSLTLTGEAVVALGDTNSAGTMVGGVDIFVRGDEGAGADRVDLLGNGWVLDAGGGVTLGSETFDVWIEESVVPSAVVAIQQGVDVNMGP